MDQQTLTLVFRLCGLAFFVSLGIFLWHFLRKKGNKTIKIAAFVSTLLFMGAIFYIIIYTANTDFGIQTLKNTENRAVTADMIDAAKENFIFQDVQVFVGIVVHLIIILSISVAYWYMWRRTKKLPKDGYTLGYKIVLLLGMCFVLGFAGYAVYNCIIDAEYREQIYFKTYTFYFLGNVIVMLIASMISAAGLPDEEDQKQQM